MFKNEDLNKLDTQKKMKEKFIDEIVYHIWGHLMGDSNYYAT